MILETKINGEIAYKALSRLSRIASANLKDSPMRMVLMEIYPSYTRLYATNSSISMSCRIPGTIISSESVENLPIFVDAEVLSSFLQTHKTPSITMKVAEDFSLIFEYPRGEFKTYWSEWKGFQGIPAVPEQKQVELLARDFVPTIRKSFRFLDSDEMRGMDRVILYLKEGKLFTMATDKFAFFLSRATVNNREAEYELTLSVDVAGILYDIFQGGDDSDEVISVSADDKRIYLSVKDIIISELQYDKKLPLYKRIFDANEVTQVFSVNTAEFTHAIESAKSVSKNRMDALRIEYKDGQLEVSLVNWENRTGIKEKVDARKVSGDDNFSVALDPTRTLNSVKCFGGKLLKICNYKEYNFISFSNPDNETMITYNAKFNNNY